MSLIHIIPFFTLTLLILNFSLTLSQQPYIGLGTVACPRRGNSKSIRGYTCNGSNRTCQAYLTFRSQPIYSSVSTISSLLASDPSLLAKANSVSLNDTFDANKLVIVPISCSCAGDYYQANTSYVVQNSETYFLIANNTFEGLTTCQALENENHDPGNIYPGRKILVPMRCACPTKNQTEKGIRYLLSYLVNWGDSVSVISKRFGVKTEITLEANSLSMTQATVYPFTTLLVPLNDKPSNSLTVLPAQQPPPPTISSSTEKNSNKKTWVYGVVGVVIALVLVLLILLAVIFFTRFLRRKQRRDSEMVSENFKPIEKSEEKEFQKGSEKLSEIISDIAQSFKVYGFEELQRATENFSPSFWIKGSVFRGVINGDLAAIKRTEGDVSKEIEILNRVNHSNVIRLSGVSFDEGRWYLVYEYAANGALSEWIYAKNVDEKFLSWMQRIQIGFDVATALDYLHSFILPPYIHKDLNSSNIFLDGDFRAKVANLSLARSAGGGDGEFPATRHIVGTRGYMAPEYLEDGIVSTKLDVYAFGILMLEILTGKEVNAVLAEGKENLLDVLSGILREESGERLKEFMDPSLKENYPLELAMFVVEIVLNCIRKEPANRPDMSEIVSPLSRTLDSSLSWENSMNFAG